MKIRHDDPNFNRSVANDLRSINNGVIACNSTVTLTASQATTVVNDRRVGKDSVISFMPLTANAATEIYGGTMYVTSANIDPSNNQFTITHANNAQTDRDFRYTVIGQTLN